MSKLPKEDLEHPVARIVGVTAEDTRISAAEKTLQAMRDAGFPAKEIRWAEKLVADAKARGLT